MQPMFYVFMALIVVLIIAEGLRHRSGRLGMTSAAWRQGRKNAMICMVPVLAIDGGLAYAVSAIYGLSLLISFMMVSVVFWFFVFAVFVFAWFYGSRVSGAVLLDCGPHPEKRMFLTGGVPGLIGGVVVFVFMLGDPFDLFRFGMAMFIFTLSIYLVMLAYGRLQIRENGLWQYWGLLRWGKIASYRWEGETDATLMVQAKSTKPALLGRGALPVSVDQKEVVDRLMRERVGGEGRGMYWKDIMKVNVVGILLIVLCVTSGEVFGVISQSNQLSIDLTDPKDTTEKAEWSEPEHLTITEKGFGRDGSTLR